MGEAWVFQNPARERGRRKAIRGLVSSALLLLLYTCAYTYTAPYWCLRIVGGAYCFLLVLLWCSACSNSCSAAKPKLYSSLLQFACKCLHQLSSNVSLYLIGYFDLSYKPREKRNSIFSKYLMDFLPSCLYEDVHPVLKRGCWWQLLLDSMSFDRFSTNASSSNSLHSQARTRTCHFW